MYAAVEEFVHISVVLQQSHASLLSRYSSTRFASLSGIGCGIRVASIGPWA